MATLLAWGEGGTDLFLNPTESGSFELLDYEFDTEKIHSIGGGRLKYKSCSGLTGNGFITKLGTLIPVGYWRVDTDDSDQCPISIDKDHEIKVMIPYQTHEPDKSSILRDHPVVILWGNEKIVYCKFEQLTKILKKILLGEFSEEGKRSLKKKLLPYNKMIPEEVNIEFYNLWGWKRPYPWPWEFKSYMGDFHSYFGLNWRYGHEVTEVMNNVFHVVRDKEGNLIRYCCIANSRYAVEVIPEEVFLNGETPISGWELGEPYTMYRVRDDDVYIVAWAPLKKELTRIIEGFARRYPEREAELIRGLLKKIETDNSYEEYELSVNKLLFFGDEEKWFKEAKKGLKNKLRRGVAYEIRKILEGRRN